jgi:hypothetical protein
MKRMNYMKKTKHIDIHIFVVIQKGKKVLTYGKLLLNFCQLIFKRIADCTVASSVKLA